MQLLVSKKNIFLLLVLYAGIFYSFGCSAEEKTYMQKIIFALANDSMQGRDAGTKYEKMAADYIQNQLLNINKKAKKQEFSYNTETGNKKICENLYYFLNHNAKKTIVLGAHYDHIGLGGKLSLSYGKKNQVHNGADDNASGVALILDLLQTEKMWATKDYNYLFVWYSGHEEGLYGSKAFAIFAQKRYKHIALAINFDMVGRLDLREKIISVSGLQTLKTKDVFFENYSSELNIQTFENELIKETDATNFLCLNIPALHFTTGASSDYHKISDDAELINYHGLELIKELIQSYLKQLKI